MPTGDITNNLRKLQKEVKLIRYSEDVDLVGLSQGTPSAFLPLYHYVFTSYSHAIAQLISATDAELYGKTDFRFMEAVYKILRDLFNYKPPITKEQFFSNGFAERKIIMCSDVVQKVREKNKALQPQKKSTTAGTAVSGISQLNTGKGSRSKSADQPSHSKTVSSSASNGKLDRHSDDKTTSKHVTIHSPPQVVNELLQPYRPLSSSAAAMHRHMPDHGDHSLSPPEHTNNHHHMSDHLSSSPQEMTSPPRITKEVLSSPDYSLQSDSRPRGFNWAVITPSISKVRSAAVEVVSVPREISPASDDSADGSYEEPVEVNAVLRGESFLEPQPQGLEQYQDEVSSLKQLLTTLNGRMDGYESMVNNLVKSPNHATESVMAVMTTVQQQLETLMARMVLVENRVSMIEAKVGDIHKSSQPVATVNSMSSPHNPVTNSVSALQHSSAAGYIPQLNSVPSLQQHSTVHSDTPQQAFQQQSMVHSDTPSQALQQHSTTPGVNPKFSMMSTLQQQQSVKQHEQGGSMVTRGHKSDLNRNSQESSSMLGLSPIRKPTDMSMNSTGLPFDLTQDTFGTSTTDNDRRSSTPAQMSHVSQEASIASFQFDDTTTQERVDRIKDLFKATEGLLKT